MSLFMLLIVLFESKSTVRQISEFVEKAGIIKSLLFQHFIHVLVNDPTTGYGIFIENMPDAAA